MSNALSGAAVAFAQALHVSTSVPPQSDASIAGVSPAKAVELRMKNCAICNSFSMMESLQTRNMQNKRKTFHVL